MSFTAIITADTSSFNRAIDSAQAKISGLETGVNQRLRNIGEGVASLGKKMSVLSGAIALAGGAAYKMAADMEDALGATEQVYKSSSESVKKWANSLPTAYGIAKNEALGYANLMGSMLMNIGRLTEDQAAKQSAALIELAGDLTAMYGGRVQDAVRALTGALKGNNTMLDNYGMAVNDALVKAKALELGVASGTGELSLQARQAATLALIWEQTGAAQGQAAREASGASGAMRAFSASVKNLSSTLGEVLLPIITPIITKITQFVEKLRTLPPETQKNIVLVTALVAALGPLLIIVGNFIKLIPVLRLAISSLAGPIGIITALVTAIALNFHKNLDAMKTDWDYFTKHLKITSQSFGDIVSGNFSGWWEKVKTTFSGNIDYLKKKFKEFKEYYTGQAEEVKRGWNPVKYDPESTMPEKVKTKETTDRVEEEVDWYRTLIGENLNLRDAVKKTTKTIEELKRNLISIQTGVLPVKNVKKAIEETEEKIDQLSTALDLLTGERNLNINVKMASASEIWKGSGLFGAMEGNKFFKNGKFTLPGIDTSLIEDGMGKFINKWEEFTVNIGQLATNMISDLASAFGRSLVDKDVDFGEEAIAALGSLLQELGKAAIALGAVSLGLQPLLANPLSAPFAIAAMVAGAAAVAAGAAMSARKTASQLGGSNSGGTGSYQNAQPAYGPSQYQGPYTDNYGTVNLRIGFDALEGSIDLINNRKNRLR